MIALRERKYLNKIYSEKYQTELGCELEKAEWYAWMDLQNADYLLNMSEDSLYWDNPCSGINSYSDVINLYDEPIRGTGKGITLDEVFIPKGIKYIGNTMGKMPLDVMIFKGKTGVGGTTLAIKDNRRWVICVGSRQIVKSKSEKHENSLGVFAIGHGGAHNDQISQYNGNTIITTWSSLDRVMEYISPDEWSLLIDEPQEFIRDGEYRSKDINNVLRLKNRFNHCTIMSATETKKTDYLNSFDDLDILRIRWEEKRVYDIEVDETKNLIANLAQRSLSVLEDDNLSNLHIFINKVESIISIVSILEKVLNTDLSDRISIVASNKASNIDRIKGIGSGNHVIEDLKSIKRINFYTSTCFSGVDIEDAFGDIVIAAKGNDAYTRLHLKYDIMQIPGRIRNPRVDMKIHLVFSKRHSNASISAEDFWESLKETFMDANRTLKYYYGLSQSGKNLTKNKSLISDSPSFELTHGRATINKAFFMNKRASYHKDNILYTELLPSDKLFKISQGDETFRFIKSEDGLYISEDIYDAMDNTTIKRSIGFKSSLVKLVAEMDDDNWEKSWWQSDCGINVNEINKWLAEYKIRHMSLFERFPIITDAFLHFSPTELKEIGFKKRDINIALGKKKNLHEMILLKQVLDLKVGIQYKSSDMKHMIKRAYEKIEVNKSVPSTYIKEIYPGIRKKKIRVDKIEVITQSEYRQIKKDNYNLSESNKIPLSKLLDKNGDVVEFHKTVRNGGRQEVYILPC